MLQLGFELGMAHNILSYLNRLIMGAQLIKKQKNKSPNLISGMALPKTGMVQGASDMAQRDAQKPSWNTALFEDLKMTANCNRSI